MSLSSNGVLAVSKVSPAGFIVSCFAMLLVVIALDAGAVVACLAVGSKKARLGVPLLIGLSGVVLGGLATMLLVNAGVVQPFFGWVLVPCGAIFGILVFFAMLLEGRTTPRH